MTTAPAEFSLISYDGRKAVVWNVHDGFVVAYDADNVRMVVSVEKVIVLGTAAEGWAL